MTGKKPPAFSIDEALRLFLAMAYPQGLPEGVDEEAFLDHLRKRIAADRPEWAASDDDAGTAQGGQSSAEESYAQRKARLIHEAQAEDVPQDPEERYLYERRQEAQRNREQKRAEERQSQKAQDLRERLIREKAGEDGLIVERALRIQQALEAGVQRALASQGLVPESLKLAGGSHTPLESSAPELDSLTLDYTPAQGEPEAGQSFLERLKVSSPEEQVASIRQFNQSRRQQMKTRRELLGERRPIKRDGKFAMPVEPESSQSPLDDAAHKAELDMAFDGAKQENLSFEFTLSLKSDDGLGGLALE